MDNVPVIKRGTPAWLDLDLSLRSRRIMFAIVAVIALFSLWLHYTCAPGGESKLAACTLACAPCLLDGCTHTHMHACRHVHGSTLHPADKPLKSCAMGTATHFKHFMHSPAMRCTIDWSTVRCVRSTIDQFNVLHGCCETARSSLNRHTPARTLQI
jgi:hypothetical protein